VRPLSIGIRLALLNAAVVAIAMIAIGAALFAAADAAILHGAEGILRDELEEVATTLRRGPLTPEELGGILEAEVRDHQSETLAFRVSRADGEILACSLSPLWEAVPRRPAGGVMPARTARVPGDGIRHRVIARRVPSVSFGPVDLEASMRLRSADAALGRLLEICLLLLPAILLAALAGGYFLSRRALAPVGRMEASARRIGTGPPGERLPGSGTGDELDRLSGTLNGMLGRLEEASARNLRFAGDVAHEVRTPLATLRARLESALAAGDGIPAEARERLEATVREVDRVEALVKSLLLICRADEGQAGPARPPLDVAAVLREVGGFFGPLAASRGIRFEVEAPDGLRVPGDATVLQRAVANLVDNALHYTDNGGEVRLRGAAENGRVVVDVEDSGCGIPEDSRARVFERFFRAEAARERNPGGSGLGLALVRAVARAHGGDATYAPRPGGGSRFRILLPRTVEAPAPPSPTS
jgi:heavy metal sensor kinase